MRTSGRQNNQLRQITIETGVLSHAEGSCLVKCGNTHVICSATVDNTIPYFLRGQNQGWITAEYGMLPRSTNQRMKRESAQGKQSGRTQEIQRLIGRSVRSIFDLKLLGERQILIDCDVINADGGTRTSAITGSYVAACLAVQSLLDKKVIRINPIHNQIAAISCGIYNGEAILDLDYSEDSEAEVDANFILTKNGEIIEIQTTAEKKPFTEVQFNQMLELAKDGIKQIISLQNDALRSHAV